MTVPVTIRIVGRRSTHWLPVNVHRRRGRPSILLFRIKLRGPVNRVEMLFTESALLTPKSDQGNPYGSPATDTKPDLVCGIHRLKHMIWKLSILTAATGLLAIFITSRQ